MFRNHQSNSPKTRKRIPKVLNLLLWPLALVIVGPRVWGFISLFTHAQPDQISDACHQVILQGEKQINKLPNVQLTKSHWDNIDMFFDGEVPRDRSYKYHYVLEDTTGIRNVFDSPFFLTQISKEVTSHCPEAGMVSFGNERGSLVRKYGLYPDNQIKVVCPPGFFDHLMPFTSAEWKDKGCE